MSAAYAGERSLDTWLDRQAVVSAEGVAACISATHLVKRRPQFGQVIVPRRGSVLASPIAEVGPEEPDYFFHWLRDSSLLMDAILPLALGQGADGEWRRRFDDFVDFSLALSHLDGQSASIGYLRQATAPEARRHLRAQAELASLRGRDVPGEVRCNPDGSLDLLHWARPQHDGPALEALVCLRFLEQGAAGTSDVLDGLIRRDLDYTQAHLAADGYDIWEEVSGDHYYTRLLQLAAMRRGVSWAQGRNDTEQAGLYEAAAASLARSTDRFATVEDGLYVCTVPPETRKSLDTSVILAVLHAGLETGPHSVTDSRALATLLALEELFAAEFPINRNRGPGLGVAMGRFRGDRYMTAGPWYICTFAAAEFRYRRAALTPHSAEARALVEAGDAQLAAAAATVPASGALTEQFSPEDGRQSSARDLGWSHAAFLTAYHARRRVVAGKNSDAAFRPDPAGG